MTGVFAPKVCEDDTRCGWFSQVEHHDANLMAGKNNPKCENDEHEIKGN